MIEMKYLKNKLTHFILFISFKWLVWRGYLDKDGAPLKCPFCRCKEIETYNTFRHDQGFIEEYWVRCKNCKEHLGTWAYGSWYN